MPSPKQIAGELYHKEQGRWPDWYPDPHKGMTETAKSKRRITLQDYLDPNLRGTVYPGSAQATGDSISVGLKARAAQPRVTKALTPQQRLAQKKALVSERFTEGTETPADSTFVRRERGLAELSRLPTKPETPQQRLSREKAERESRFLGGVATPTDSLTEKRSVGLAALRKQPEKPKEMTKKDYDIYRNRRESLRDKLLKIESLETSDFSAIEDETLKVMLAILGASDASPEALARRKNEIQGELDYTENQMKPYEIKQKLSKIPKKYQVEGKVLEDTNTDPPTPYIFKNGKWIALERTQ